MVRQRREMTLTALAAAALVAAGCGGGDGGDAGTAARASTPAVDAPVTTPQTTSTATTPADGSATSAHHATRHRTRARHHARTKDDSSHHAGSSSKRGHGSDDKATSSHHRTSSSSKTKGKKKQHSHTTSPSSKKGSSGSSSAPTKPASDPGLGPLPTGSYDCDTSGFLKGGGITAQIPSTTQLQITTLSSGVQQQSRDLRNSSGNGPMTRVVLVYDSAGVHLRTLELSGKLSIAKDDRTLNASGDPLFLSAHPQAGEQHDFSLSGSGVRAQVTVKVGGSDTVNGVAVWLLDVDVDFSGEISGTTHEDQAIAKSNGFPVREHAVTDLTLKVGSSHSEYTATTRRVPGGG